MSIIYIRKRLDSETLHLPELKPFIGKIVEISIKEEQPPAHVESPYEAFFALAGQNVVDADALEQLRAASRL